MTDLTNNLFYYATKELSQDAMLCWLCSYALEGYKGKNPEITKCARELILCFLNMGLNEKVEDFLLQKVEKQVKNIDVLLSVECNKKTYKIIIEDKTHTSEHDDQLSRYKAQLETNENKVDGVIGIYFKTGFQSDYTSVEKAGYHVFKREDLLEILDKYDNISNDIFRSYHEYWKDFEVVAQSFSKHPTFDWDWRQINGFFDYLQGKIAEKEEYWSGYGYVANPSGGFWGLWYGHNDDRIVFENGSEFTLYLQIEISWSESSLRYENRICLKLELIKDNDEGKTANSLRNEIVKIQGEYGFSKPKYVRKGRHMTVGVFCESISSYVELLGEVENSLYKYGELHKYLKGLSLARFGIQD